MLWYALPARPAGARPVSSLWTDGAPELDAPPLERDADFDVAVLGAGITGVTCAHLLAKEGRVGALIDAGGSATACRAIRRRRSPRSTGWRCPRSPPATVPRRRARTPRPTVAGVEQIVAAAAELGIECDLRRKPAFVWAATQEQVADVEEEVGRRA